MVNENGNWHEVNGLHAVNGTNVTVTVGNANYAALFVVLSGDDQTLDAGTTYVFEGTITATKAATVSVYLESRDNNEGQHMFDDNTMNLAANTPYNFSVEATNPQVLTNPDMTISVANGPANTTYTLTNVKIREKTCAVNIDETPVAQAEFLQVVPNPVQQRAVIEASKEISSVSLFNLAGQKVAEFDSVELDLSGMSQGLYLLKVNFADGSNGQTKLIKQ